VRVQKELGGGLCPISSQAVCTWADFCALGLNPMPWVEYMTTGKMTPGMALELGK
jgi:hypothetical protein